MAFRFAGLNAAARAAPPLAPPSFPSATAAGFFPGFLSGSGFPSHCSPMACSTTRFATVVKSWFLLERVGTVELYLRSVTMSHQGDKEIEEFEREEYLRAERAGIALDNADDPEKELSANACT